MSTYPNTDSDLVCTWMWLKPSMFLKLCLERDINYYFHGINGKKRDALINYGNNNVAYH